MVETYANQLNSYQQRLSGIEEERKTAYETAQKLRQESLSGVSRGKSRQIKSQLGNISTRIKQLGREERNIRYNIKNINLARVKGISLTEQERERNLAEQQAFKEDFRRSQIRIENEKRAFEAKTAELETSPRGRSVFYTRSGKEVIVGDSREQVASVRTQYGSSVSSSVLQEQREASRSPFALASSAEGGVIGFDRPNYVQSDSRSVSPAIGKVLIEGGLLGTGRPFGTPDAQVMNSGLTGAYYSSFASATIAGEQDLLRTGQRINLEPKQGERRRVVSRTKTGEIQVYTTKETAIAPIFRTIGSGMEYGSSKLLNRAEDRNLLTPFTRTVLTGVVKQSKRLKGSPDDFIGETIIAYEGGRIIGTGTGAFTTVTSRTTASKLGSEAGLKAGVATERAVVGTGAIIAGTTVYADPSILADPKFIAGGVGFYKGFKTTPSPTLNVGRVQAVGNVRGSVTDLPSGVRQIRAKGEFAQEAYIEGYGLKTPRTIKGNFLAEGTSETAIEGVKINVFAKGQTKGLGTKSYVLSETYGGVIRNKEQFLVNLKSGEVTFTKLGNVRTEFITDLGSEITPVTFKQRNFMGVSGGGGASETNTLFFGRQAQTSFMGNTKGLVRTQVADFNRGEFRPDFNVFRGRGRQVFTEEGASVLGRSNRRFVDRNLFSRGQSALREEGYLRQPSSIRSYDILNNKKGNIRTSRTTIKPNNIIKSKPVLPEFTGLNFRSLSLTPKAFTGIRLDSSTNIRTEINNNQLPKFDSKSSIRTREVNDILPKFDFGTDIINRQERKIIDIPSFDTSQITTQRTITPFPPSTGTTPPPPTPVGGGAFIFATGIPPSGSSRTIKSKGRTFEYAPDLISSVLNIKGKEKKGALTGFELRPVSKKKKGKKK